LKSLEFVLNDSMVWVYISLVAEPENYQRR
jgi:hypothetical protein